MVAPIQCSSPLASIGFNKFPASIAPSVLPAPTIKCNSSINNIILPSLFFTSPKTALSLSSNSPRYFAPAIKDPISKENNFLSFSPVGTSPLEILIAKPSTTAVLPTPASPIKTGLFLVFLDKICITFLISSSLPITGSIFCALALSTKSTPYLLSTSYVSSGLSVVTLTFPLTSINAFIKAFMLKLQLCNTFFTVLSPLSNKAINKCSTETKSSFISVAFFSAELKTLFKSGDK